MRLLPRRVAITAVEDDGDFDISHWLWTAKEVTTDPIGPYMIAASPRAGAAGLSGTTSAPVATCPAREDALDAQRVRTMTAEDEGPALEDSGPRVCGGSPHPLRLAAYTYVHGPPA